jgi:hypothetical protein
MVEPIKNKNCTRYMMFKECEKCNIYDLCKGNIDEYREHVMEMEE